MLGYNRMTVKNIVCNNFVMILLLSMCNYVLKSPIFQLGGLQINLSPKYAKKKTRRHSIDIYIFINLALVFVTLSVEFNCVVLVKFTTFDLINNNNFKTTKSHCKEHYIQANKASNLD